MKLMNTLSNIMNFSKVMYDSAMFSGVFFAYVDMFENDRSIL